MRLVLVMSLLVLATGCGGPQNTPAPAAAKPRFETRWLRGISATEVKAIAQGRGLGCQGPTLESGTNVWRCTARTPLVDYRVQFYGSAPLKLEYITATVEQAGGNATADLVRPLFVGLAGLHYDGGDAQQARAWVSKAIASPAEVSFGPGKFKLSGDLQKITLDIKASGADW